MLPERQVWRTVSERLIRRLTITSLFFNLSEMDTLTLLYIADILQYFVKKSVYSRWGKPIHWLRRSWLLDLCIARGGQSVRVLLWLVFLIPATVSAQPGWGPDRRLVYILGHSWHPKADASGDTVHLVWYQSYQDSSGTNHREVFYKRSIDGGDTWGEDVLLSLEDYEESVVPDVAVNGDAVHVVWAEYGVGIEYRRSLNGGTTWGPIDTVCTTGYHPCVAVTADTVYVTTLMSTGGQGSVIFARSTDSGNTWLPYEVISDKGVQVAELEVAWPYLHVVSNMQDPSLYSAEIFYLRSSDGGRTWSGRVIISEIDSVGSQLPSLGVDSSSNPHSAWFDYKYSPYPWTGDIFYRTSRDTGQSWDEIHPLTTEHRATWSDILAEGCNLHLVWEDDRNGFDDNTEIYYRTSTDLGEIWLEEVRLTDAPGWSHWPTLAVGSGHLHLFWSDDRDDTTPLHILQLYYKRKGLTGVDEETGVRAEHSLSIVGIEPYPNPCMAKVVINYFFLVNFSTPTTVKIYDLSGGMIRVLVNSEQEPGFYTTVWDGKDSAGKEVRNGVYLCRVVAGDWTATAKVVVIR